MKNTIFGILLIAFGAFICVRREWLADKLQNFLSTYPLVRLAAQHQLRSRGSFILVLGLLFAALGMAAIAEQWIS